VPIEPSSLLYDPSIFNFIQLEGRLTQGLSGGSFYLPLSIRSRTRRPHRLLVLKAFMLLFRLTFFFLVPHGCSDEG
jgi:hypothetical protein